MKRMFGSQRYANVTATVALIVALGGTSYAAIALPANSVGRKQLKKGAVTNSELRANAVTSAKVKNGSLRAKDFAGGQLPAGPAGPAGATNIVGRRSASQPVEPGALGALTMTCNPGERAINGGLQGIGAPPPEANIFTITDSFPTTTSALVGDVPTGWYVEARNMSNASDHFLAFVICAQS
jgi:hypothetical protein